MRCARVARLLGISAWAPIPRHTGQDLHAHSAVSGGALHASEKLARGNQANPRRQAAASSQKRPEWQLGEGAAALPPIRAPLRGRHPTLPPGTNLTRLAKKN